MRILYFVQYFNLPHEPGGSRAFQFARAWVRAGHEVTVVTGAVNHKTLTVPPAYSRRLAVQERVEGIRILRVWSYAGIRGSFRKRLLNFVSYAITAALVGWVRGGSADVIYASSTPLTVGLPGWFNALLRRRPWVFELRDLWPQSAIVAGVLDSRSVMTRVAAWLSRRFYRSAKRVVAVTRGIAEGLAEEGVPPSRIVLVPNGVDDWMLEAGETELPRPTDPPVLVYCGALGRMNSLGQIVDAAQLLTDFPLEIHFIGDGDERQQLEQRVEQAGLENVRFFDAMPKKQVFEELRRASAAIVVTWDVAFQKMVLANKIFDYLAAATPVVVAAAGEMAELVQQAGCGVVTPPENPQELARAMRELLAQPPSRLRAMGQAGRRFILEGYQRRDLAWMLLRCFEEITGRPARAEQVRPRQAVPEEAGRER